MIFTCYYLMWGNIQFYARLWFLFNDHHWFAFISSSLTTTKLPLCGSAMAARLERSVCLCTICWSQWIQKEYLDWGGGGCSWQILCDSSWFLQHHCCLRFESAAVSTCLQMQAHTRLHGGNWQNHFFSDSHAARFWAGCILNSIPGTWGMVPAPAPRVCVNINVPIGNIGLSPASTGWTVWRKRIIILEEAWIRRNKIIKMDGAMR